MKRLIILLLFATHTAIAGTENLSVKLNGSALTQGAMLTLKDPWYEFTVTHPAYGFPSDPFFNTFVARQLSNYVSLKFTDSEQKYYDKPWSLTLTYDISLKGAGGSTLPSKQAETLTIQFNPTGTCTPVAMKKYAGGFVTSVRITSVTPSSGAFSGGIPPDIMLEIVSEVERDYIFNSATQPALTLFATQDSINYAARNELLAAWEPLQGAEYYDLEWLFIDTGDEQPGKGFPYDWRNATRVRVSENHYVLPLAYPAGLLLCRVRGVGRFEPEFTSLKPGCWSLDNHTPEGNTLNTPSAMMYVVSGLEPLLNWQYTASYAEEGKRKEALSFFDGSGRGRQFATLLNTRQQVMVNEQVYDYEGREALQIMPAPAPSEGLRYYPQFNGGFNVLNFDSDSKAGNPDPLSTASGAGQYYSPYNPATNDCNAYIPDAGGYPYLRTRFTPDGTGRIRSRSGAGIAHKPGSGHETKYFYGTPASQQELDRLFGNEVGIVSHYKKNMVQDANGQVVVNYLDQEGRTIATALAGDVPANLIPVDTAAPATTFSANLLARDERTEDGLISWQSVTVPAPTAFDFTYSLTGGEYCTDSCLSDPEHNCAEYRYDITLEVVNEEGVVAYTHTLNDIPGTTGKITFSVPLDPGTYRVTRTLRINTQALERALFNFSSFQQCVRWEQPPSAFSSCGTTCGQLCTDTYMHTEDGITFYHDRQGNPVTETQAYDSIQACIASACAPPDAYPDICTMQMQLLKADMSPGGQYFDNLSRYSEFDEYGNRNPSYEKNGWLKNKFGEPFTLEGIPWHTWDDVRTHWDTGYADILLKHHPEYCAYLHFCEQLPACTAGYQYYFSSGQDYEKLLYKENDDSYGTLAPYYFFNPAGLPQNNDAAGGYVQNHEDYQPYPKPQFSNGKYLGDPCFCPGNTETTDMEMFLRRFLYPDPVMHPGVYYSIWYVLDDPHGIGLWDTITQGNFPMGNAVVNMFKTIHNELLTSGVSKYEFFRSVYAFYKNLIQYNRYRCSSCPVPYALPSDDEGFYEGVFQLRIQKSNPLFEKFCFDYAHCSTSAYGPACGTTPAGFIAALEALGENQLAAGCDGLPCNTYDTIWDSSGVALLPDLPDDINAAVNAQCMEETAQRAGDETTRTYKKELAEAMAVYKSNFINACLDNMDSRETFQADYLLKEYHYTLYYYDQAGNLVKTVPPEGVRPLTALTGPGSLQAVADYRNAVPGSSYTTPTHTFVTNYKYNTYDLPVESTTPDAGFSAIMYDELGRMVASQNAKQKNLPANTYSYTVYDERNRPAETGQCIHPTIPLTATNARNYLAYQTWLAETNKTEITRIFYDKPYIAPPVFTQQNTRNRPVSMTLDHDGNGDYEHATHYSYDVHGNVKALLQDNALLATGNPQFINQRYKKTDYAYDLLSGNVNNASYQQGNPDQFYHRYEYDADNRITNAYTSRDGVLWDCDAKYFYYLHGPMARTELGNQKIQGLDYAYTIQGWIKGVNSETLSSARDMGKDGASTGSASSNPNKNFARDAFGYSLGYYNGDYNNIGNTSNFMADKTAASYLSTDAPGLFNGNISSMVTSLTDIATGSPTLGQAIPQLTAYRYDQLNRIKQMKAYRDINLNSNTWGNGSTYDGSYETHLAYDANGSILSLKRNGLTGISSGQMDDLTYAYETVANGYTKNTNKLRSIQDAVASNIYTDDMNNQVANNYAYDEIGNMVRDTFECIQNIEWTMYGKVKKVTRYPGCTSEGTTMPDLEFKYDAKGNVIAKIVKPAGQINNPAAWITTHYSVDVLGNLIASYEEQYDLQTQAASYQLISYELYGSNHIGTDKSEKEMIGATVDITSFIRTLDKKFFFLFDHRNNNNVTITDRKIPVESTVTPGTIAYFEPDIVRAVDYFPFGREQNGRIFNRNESEYGYNGKQNIKEWSARLGAAQLYGMRIKYGERFLSVDPKAAKMPAWSPYSFCFNNPLKFVDLDGAIPTPVEGAKIAGHIYDGKIGDVLDGGWRLDKVYTSKDNSAYRSGLYSRTVDGVTEYAMANAGTYFENSKRGRGSMSEDLEQPFGGSENMIVSIRDAKQVSRDVGKAELTFVGHSKGGAEAAGNALATNRNALLYNPAAINADAYGLDTKKYTGRDYNGKVPKGMTVFIVKGDMLNSFINQYFAKPIDKAIYLPQQSKNPVINHLMKSMEKALNEYYKTNRPLA